MGSEQDRIGRIMESLARGEDVGNKLVYDRNTKTVSTTPKYKDPDGTMMFTPSDMELYG